MRAYPVPLLLSIAIATPLAAMDSQSVGPRAMGMGGTGTAAADDNSAQFYNPALYGFFHRTDEKGETLACDPNDLGRKDWGLGLVDATMEVELRGRLGDFVQRLSDSDLGKLQDIGGASASAKDLKTAMTAIGLLGEFSPKRDNVLMRMNVGVLDLRVLHVGIGARMYAEGVVSIADLDTTNLGFGTGTLASVVTDINAPATTPAGWTAAHNVTLFTGSALANTQNAMAQSLAGVNYAAASAPQQAEIDSAISKLDFAAGQAGLSASEIGTIAGGNNVALIAAINASGAAGTSFDNNTTAAFVGGFTVAELPLTVGYAINDNLAVGGSVKLMVGRVAGAKARLLKGTDDISSLLQDSFADSNQTVTGGLDLGIAARNSWAQAGLTVRNLNRPVLKGGTFKDSDHQAFTVADVDLDPQVSLGVAVYPFRCLTITADLDLTRNETVISTTSRHTGLPAGTDRTLSVKYGSQNVAAGAEWKIPYTPIELRAGVSKDLYETNVGPVLHAGFGLNLWAVRIDLAASASTDQVTLDGKDRPKALGVSAGLAVDF